VTRFPFNELSTSAVLQMAIVDKGNGKFDESLAKLQWCFAGEQGPRAVRTYVVLRAWADLAAQYPPALEALFQIRDEFESACRTSPGFQLFKDCASLNDHLNCDHRTTELFVEISKTDFHSASQFYHVAEKYLVRNGLFHICELFLECEGRVETLIRAFRISTEVEAEHAIGPYQDLKISRQIFVDGISSLIALLVCTGRKKDATHVYARCQEVLDDLDFRSSMELAMTGVFSDEYLNKRECPPTSQDILKKSV